MADPYETLCVQKSATAAEIKARFKKLARRRHPDLHPDEPGAEARFKAITAANDPLGDPEKRRRYDAGEIDAAGAERPSQPSYRDFADGPGYGDHAAQDVFASRDGLEAFLNEGFGRVSRGRRDSGPARGADASYALPVAFLDAANGAARTVRLPDGKTLTVTIPEGAEDRQMLRLKGQGGPGFDGGPPGDAYVELHVAPHAFFTRRDDDIHVEIPITLREAVLGAKIAAPTISGPVSLTVPKGAATGAALRLRGEGVLGRRTGVRGHQFVTLTVVPPNGDEPELEAFLKNWALRDPQDPRQELMR